MAFPKRQAAIVGTYTTEQARNLERTSVSLKLEAIKGALADAGCPRDIDGIVPMESSMHGPGLVYHMYWAEQLGGRPLVLHGHRLGLGRRGQGGGRHRRRDGRRRGGVLGQRRLADRAGRDGRAVHRAPRRGSGPSTSTART